MTEEQCLRFAAHERLWGTLWFLALLIAGLLLIRLVMWCAR